MKYFRCDRCGANCTDGALTVPRLTWCNVPIAAKGGWPLHLCDECGTGLESYLGLIDGGDDGTGAAPSPGRQKAPVASGLLQI